MGTFFNANANPLIWVQSASIWSQIFHRCCNVCVYSPRYIEVTWNYPQTAQVGEYVCEINAITALGHPVTFKDTVEVIETTPSIGQLVSSYFTTVQGCQFWPGIVQSQMNRKLILKSPRFVPFGANLTQFQNKPDIP